MAGTTAVKPTSASTINPDLSALKIRQQAAWSSGTYAVVGTTLQIVGEQLCDARRRAPLVRRHLHRLCARFARTGTRARVR